MSNVLRQRNLFVTKVFEITDKSLKVKNSNLFKSTEYDVLFNAITEKTVRRSVVSIPFVCLTILFLLLSLKEFISIYFSNHLTIALDYLIAYLAVTITLIIVTLLKKTKTIYILVSNGMRVEMYSNKPNEDLVNDFLKVLQVKKNSYLTKKTV